MHRTVSGAALAVLLAGCAGHDARPVARTPQDAARHHAMTEPGEAVWHLRAGLNVAALSCRGRGREPVAGSYAKLLSRHRTLLASAYAGEQRRHGKGLDRHLTQVYNRFAYQRSPANFCHNAAAVAQEAVRMDSSTLSSRARSLLGRLG